MPEESLSDFEKHVRFLIQSVTTIANPSFRKVLYFAMIDGLSHYCYPDIRRAGDRFVRFVNEYGDWSDCHRVSLPQADLLLRETTNADPILLSEVSRRLEQWPTGALIDLDADPFLDELPEPRDTLRDCQHGRLLWALRNTLLHEFRHPGLAFERLASGKTAPFYHGMLSEGQDTWELVIPAEFLSQLALSCLEGLMARFRSESVDPDSRVYQGRSWVTRLRSLGG